MAIQELQNARRGMEVGYSRKINGKTMDDVACQGLGASVWYPCKDHQSDEPDNGAIISYYCSRYIGCSWQWKIERKKIK